MFGSAQVRWIWVRKGSAAPKKSSGFVTPQKVTGTSVAGITVCTCVGMPLGDGTLAWTPSTKTVTWTPFGGTPTYVVRPNVSGMFQLGTNPRMLVYVDLNTTPVGSDSKTLTVVDNPNSIFDDISGGEAVAGSVEYRCLWLTNYSAETATCMVEVATPPANTYMLVGSEYRYTSEFPMFAPTEVEAVNDRTCAFLMCHEKMNPYETQVEGADLALHFGTLAATFGYQATDGQTGDLPVTITGETDPTNLLAGVEWKQNLTFNRALAPGAVVSFWLKRWKLPLAVAPTTDTFELNVSYETDIVTLWREDNFVYCSDSLTVQLTATLTGIAYAGSDTVSYKRENYTGRYAREDGSGVLAREG